MFSAIDLLAAACDDDLVAQSQEGFCKTPSDAGTAASNEDCVAGSFHNCVLFDLAWSPADTKKAPPCRTERDKDGAHASAFNFPRRFWL